MINQQEIMELRDQARHFRNRADELDSKAFEKQQQFVKEVMRETKDRMLNRKQAMELLWFGSHQALKDWEKKVRCIGYLPFENNKILRSEVLRFRDDYHNGKLHRKLRKRGNR